MAEGFFSGMEEGLQMQQNLQIGSLRAEGLKVGIEQEKVALQQSKLMLAGQERIAAAMAKMNTQKAGPMSQLGDQTEEMAGTLDSLGMMYLGANQPEQGEKLLNRASVMRKNHAQLLEANSKREIDDMQEVSNLMQNVHDKEGFQDAAKAFILARPGSVNAYGGLIQKIVTGEVQYSPKIVEVLKDAAIKHVDKVRADLYQARIKSEGIADAEKTRNTALIDKKLEVEGLRADKLRAEGVNPKPVTPSLLARVVDQASDEYDVVSNAPDARRRAFPIAERVSALMKADPTMKESEAITKAYDEMKGKAFSGAARRDAAVKGGSAKDRPLTQPEADGTLRPNSWYETNEGVKKTDDTGLFDDDDDAEQPDD